MRQLPRVALCNLPTPLNEAPRLSAILGGPRIFIKRDDLTGLAMGGNKGRTLEFIMADAKEMGADTIIATGERQSNLVCQVSAAARKLGIDAVLVLRKGIHNEVQGNLLLDNLLGVEIRLTDIEVYDHSTVITEMDNLAKQLRSRGRKPYVLYPGTKTPLKAVGYVYGAAEVCEQLRKRGLTAQYLFTAVGSGCTQAGLILGAKYFEAHSKVVGIMMTRRERKEEKVHSITSVANELARLLEMNLDLDDHEIILYDEYAGESSAPTKESIEAVKLVAQAEGVFLDPVYTGKAMAGLIDQIHQGNITADDTVVFYHTGGLPAIFACSGEMLEGGLSCQKKLE